VKFAVVAISMLLFSSSLHAQEAKPADAAPTTAAPKIAGMFDAAPPEKGQIIFYRPGGAGPGCMVREGQGAAETHLSKLTSNRYFVYYANPGAHHYWAKNLTKDDINLEIEAGETYFVKCEIAIGLMSSGPDLSPSDAVEFERYKAKLKPMDAPAPDQADKAAH